MTNTATASPPPSTTFDHHWMPFTGNRAFKQAPRMLVSAKDMHFRASNGQRVLDGTAGLWCVNAGHCREPIVTAIAEQAGRLDYAPGFQLGHPLSFELATRLTQLLDADASTRDLDHVFFTNSGSEAVDSALKIALAYHRANGEPERVRFVGRLRGYHGVGFGGISVGGIEANRAQFAAQALPQVDHLPHTHDLARNAFSKGQPEHGAELADELETIIQRRGAATIAAVIVEPVAGSTGVLIPPKGYLERLRAICDAHGILLIFDEVITGFGRLGAAFGATYFGVAPDLMTVAKGISNGAVPMGAVFARHSIYDTVVTSATQKGIELFHGYTYSGHPLACAAALATLDTYLDENLFEKAIELGQYWEDAIHALKGLPNVIDIRNFGLIGAVELAPREGAPGARGYDAFNHAFHEQNLMVRCTGDVLALSPPLILQKDHIDLIFDRLAATIRATA